MNGHSQTLQREHMRPTEMEYLTDDQQLMMKCMIEEERNGQKVKRTKSFWKFGRSASEDILEGMALWRHRDLVDIVPEYKRRLIMNEIVNNPIDKRHQMARPMVEKNDDTLKRNMAKMSIDDKTIDKFDKYKIQKSKSASSIIPIEVNKLEKSKSNGAVNHELIKNNSPTKVTNQQRMEEEYNARNDHHSNNSDLTNTSTIKTNFENCFYDDENGDGFVVKTLKRKEILQQYDNESLSGSETERNSIASSTDPYDCIIVDDHMTMRKQREMENRKLQAQQQNKYNTKESDKPRSRRSYAPEISDSDNGFIKPQLRATLSSERQKKPQKEQQQNNQRLSTFKNYKDVENDGKIYSDSNDTLKYSERGRKEDKYYQNHETDSKKVAKNKNKYYSNEQQQQQRGDQHKRQSNGRHERLSMSYYAEQSDDHKYNSEISEHQKPQLLPRTKLLKSPASSNGVGPTMQTVMKFEQEIGLMEYRSPPRERTKGMEQDELMLIPGTTYGPWFDLWNREQSVRK